MTHKKGDDDEDRKDLTRIEDLSEFLHEEDPELEGKFSAFTHEPKDDTRTDMTSGIALDELDDQEAPPAIPSESQDFSDGTVHSIESADIEALDSAMEADVSFSEDFSMENEEVEDIAESSLDALPDVPEFSLENNELSDEFTEGPTSSLEELEPEFEEPEALTPHYTEKFEEVKNFAQNFSYGQIEGGGNPPYSLIVRNLVYEQDANDIMDLLSEFGIVNDSNLEETKKAMELGSLLIPQISEYCAIVLAHKLRRFDCDLEVGLSDEVHPSRSGESNPRGLIKKESLKQNITESYKADSESVPSKEILVSTTSTLENYDIIKYLGVETSFAVVDVDELSRLQYVQKALREERPLTQYETEEDFSSEEAFKEYKTSFDHLFDDLCDQLKSKAMKKKANALVGLQYQISSLPLEKAIKAKESYQLICSATLAYVRVKSS